MAALMGLRAANAYRKKQHAPKAIITTRLVLGLRIAFRTAERPRARKLHRDAHAIIVEKATLVHLWTAVSLKKTAKLVRPVKPPFTQDKAPAAKNAIGAKQAVPNGVTLQKAKATAPAPKKKSKRRKPVLKANAIPVQTRPAKTMA